MIQQLLLLHLVLLTVAPTNDWIHRPSGFSFPSKIDKFVREDSLGQFSETAPRVRVVYGYDVQFVVARIAIEPTEGVDTERRMQRLRETLETDKEEEQTGIESAPISIIRGENTFEGFKLAFRYRSGGAEFSKQIHLLKVGTHFLRISASAPVNADGDGSKSIERFLSALPFPAAK